MGLIIEDFATWTEKVRRRLLRESGDAGKSAHDRLPEGVPVSVASAVEFIEALLEGQPPADIVAKAETWKDKLCRIRTSKRDPNSHR